MSEAQVAYVLQAMQSLARSGSACLEVREDVEAGYNGAIQRRLQATSWSQVEDSWYKSGRLITNNWPGSVGEYRRRLRSFDRGDYVLG